MGQQAWLLLTRWVSLMTLLHRRWSKSLWLGKARAYTLKRIWTSYMTNWSPSWISSTKAHHKITCQSKTQRWCRTTSEWSTSWGFHWVVGLPLTIYWTKYGLNSLRRSKLSRREEKDWDWLKISSKHRWETSLEARATWRQTSLQVYWRSTRHYRSNRRLSRRRCCVSQRKRSTTRWTTKTWNSLYCLIRWTNVKRSLWGWWFSIQISLNQLLQND